MPCRLALCHNLLSPQSPQRVRLDGARSGTQQRHATTDRDVWWLGPVTHAPVTPTPLNTIRPASQLKAAKNLEQILYQLTRLRDRWQLLDTSKKIQSLNVAADGLDDIVGLIDPIQKRIDTVYTPVEKKIVFLFLAALLFGAGVWVGVKLERQSLNVQTNFARVGP